MIAALVDRLRQKDRNALARLLSYAARGERLGEIQAALNRGQEAGGRRQEAGGSVQGDRKLTADSCPLTPGRVIAFTGSGGVGKSTLIGKLIPLLRGQDLTVAILACDPQSPLSGGALLGDRFRMGNSTDDGVFIRSLAALSHRGGLADHLDVMIGLLERFGFDVILIETVGAGQGDVAVHALADAVVLLLQPESGDDVQWDKAGILECADIVVVHKADLPSADDTAAGVRAALDLSARHVPVLRVSTKANTGHAELWQAIQALPVRRSSSSASRRLWQSAIDLLDERFRAAEARHDPELIKLAESWRRGEMPTDAALRQLFEALVRS